MTKSVLQAETKTRKPFDSLEAEASLNILRTSVELFTPLNALFRKSGVTQPQYNILRILRGAGEAGIPCQEIGSRMITRMPDITRLVDKLETSGLARRDRTSPDRRVVLVSITDKGEKLLQRLDAPVNAMHKKVLGHMTREDLQAINRLMVKARQAGE